jgi:hypothetical protein
MTPGKSNLGENMPQRTIELLNELSALGFSDSDFCMVHHFLPPVTIQQMLTYCGEHDRFQRGRNNEKARLRLEIVLRQFRNGNYPQPAPPRVFRSLCKAAVGEIPLPRRRRHP